MREKNWGRIEDIEILDASALAPKITKRNIFGPDAFWEDFVMRHFILPEGEDDRSEERRVGKECRSRWSPYH